MNSATDEKSQGSTLADETFDPINDGVNWGILLLKFLVILSAIYSPDFAAIALIDYLKLSPEIVLVFIPVFMPILVAIMIARTGVVFYWIIVPIILAIACFSLSVPIIVFVFIILSIIEQFLKIFFGKSIMTLQEIIHSKIIASWKLLGNIEKCMKRILPPRKVNRFIFFLTLITLYLCYLNSNPISRSWFAKYNTELEIKTKLHYFCQLTGAYNKEECGYWLGKKVKFKVDK